MMDRGRFISRESQKPTATEAGMERLRDKSLRRACGTYGRHVAKGTMVKNKHTVKGSGLNMGNHQL